MVALFGRPPRRCQRKHRVARADGCTHALNYKYLTRPRARKPIEPYAKSFPKLCLSVRFCATSHTHALATNFRAHERNNANNESLRNTIYMMLYVRCSVWGSQIYVGIGRDASTYRGQHRVHFAKWQSPNRFNNVREYSMDVRCGHRWILCTPYAARSPFSGACKGCWGWRTEVS